MKIKYVWKEISCDGLLKDPEEQGPHYDKSNINGYYGYFNSITEAEKAFDDFTKNHCDTWSSPDCILVKIYSAG